MNYLFDAYIILMSVAVGIFYRFSEVEYVWSKATWRWKGDNKQPVRLRSWVTYWMMGIIPEQKVKTWQWWFHRLTFSFFEDGYHFFGNLQTFLPYISIVACSGYILYNGLSIDINWWTLIVLSLVWPLRWIGTQLGRWLLMTEDFTE